MARSVSFDDDDDDELYVFSGEDLLTAHYDVVDLDWREVAERSAVDERRGLVIAQVAILEDLIDEFILYLADPIDSETYQRDLDRQTIKPRLEQLNRLLVNAEIVDGRWNAILDDLRTIIDRRNDLAHGTLHCRAVQPVEPACWLDTIPLEWVIATRKHRTVERITMAGLRQDLRAAVGCFTSVLQYAEWFVEVAPTPVNFLGGRFLAPPTD
jgi:hypothetical protein